MMDILLVHDDLATPRITRHPNAHSTQTTPRDAASRTHARLLAPPHATLRPRCPRTHSLLKWPFRPSASSTLAHAIMTHHIHARARMESPAHASPLGCRTERRSPLRACRLARTRPLARKSRVALAATAMIAVPPLSCFSATFVYTCTARLPLVSVDLC